MCLRHPLFTFRKEKRSEASPPFFKYSNKDLRAQKQPVLGCLMEPALCQNPLISPSDGGDRNPFLSAWLSPEISNKSSSVRGSIDPFEPIFSSLNKSASIVATETNIRLMDAPMDRFRYDTSFFPVSQEELF
ncbi:hypothetical protein AVEN_125031-1 [Araneus ventricosus]|uniref:Uncharacterized protein n=1 Tax=Araneus ventricosus TaxID=182803 RepID=A0A4Y2GVW7_ARAVE|nr:hypothetical protein AVEN_125031-1 [Araneus ventricosus]